MLKDLKEMVANNANKNLSFISVQSSQDRSSASPPDVRKWLCPSVAALPEYLGLRPNVGHSPYVFEEHLIRRGKAAASHPVAKPLTKRAVVNTRLHCPDGRNEDSESFPVSLRPTATSPLSRLEVLRVCAGDGTLGPHKYSTPKPFNVFVS